MDGKAVIIMGSERDLDFSREIAKNLKLLGVNYEFRVASAHKTPQKVLEIIKEFETEKVVFVNKWTDVLTLLEKDYPSAAKVGVYPNSEIQYFTS